MNTPALIAALRTACRAPLHLGPALTAAMVLRLGYLCLALSTALSRLVHRTADPRLVLAHAELAEKVAQQAHRDQLAAARDAETTGAHALSLDSYAALRVADEDPQGLAEDVFRGEPQRVQGRACYKNTAELLAAWLGISYFEARRRIDDAHLLIGRRTPEGTTCAPRFPNLAALSARGTADRRMIAATARKLEKLEPEDTTFEGTPTELVARGADGRTLQAAAAQTLDELGPRAAQKQISQGIKLYKALHGKKIPPKLGLFIGPVVDGVHFFSLRTDATDAQLVHSVSSQAGNPRTQAGRADRQADQERSAGNEVAQEQPPAGAADGPAAPHWLRSDQPMPPWAGDDSADGQDQQAAGAPGAAAHAEDPPAAEQPAPDAPDAAVRRLNALMALLRAPYTGGTRKVVVPKCYVYLWLADLQNLAEAHGMTSDGVDIPPGELRRLLAAAEIIPLVLGGNSQVLDMGRKMRYHQGPIREAIMARDRGCIVPDCTAPADHVETDHYQTPWSEGGETSVLSGAGMCTPDHHKRHAGQLEVIDVDGLPHVILPEHLDPEQRPRRNTYWGALQAGQSPARENPPEPGDTQEGRHTEPEDPDPG